MKETRKPAGFQPGSQKGRAIQHLSDAIKQARSEGFAWVTFQGRRLKIVPFATDPSGLQAGSDGDVCPGIEGSAISRIDNGFGVFASADALIRSKDGISLSRIWRHEGRCQTESHGKHRYFNDEEILAIVVENHERE